MSIIENSEKKVLGIFTQQGRTVKNWIAMGVPLALVIGGICGGSPYYAACPVRNAAIEADTDKLDDFT
ncbi:hypothetical protein J2X73_004584 [Novosphingobium sp. 1748]|nr:hypothetical protein [Novosphingobium sp. 1748]